MRGISNVRLVGVEASKGHYEYMHTHFVDNGLDPGQHWLIHGIVGPADGVAEFPVLPQPDADWGAAAIFANGHAGNGSSKRWRDLRPWRAIPDMIRSWARNPASSARPTERLPCFSLATLLRPYPRVDLVHFDIQGDEYRVVASSLDILKQKVKRMVVATHTRSIEQELLDDLPFHSWVLEADEASKYRQHGQGVIQYMDGCQVWRNSVFDSREAAQG